MGDIDFDELDKAVNSLMSNGNTTSSSTPVPAGQVAVAPTGVPTPTPTPTPPPVQSSRGQFMDIKPPAAQVPVVPSNAPTPPLQSAPLTLDQSPSNPSDTTQPVTEPAPQAPLQPAEQAVSSPFLPNAQVEKRPLGGAIPPAEGASAPAVAEPATVAPTSNMPKLNDAFGDKEEAPADTIMLNGYKKPIDTSGDNQRALDPTNLNKKLSPEDTELAKLESREVSETSLSPEDATQGASVMTVESGDTEHLKSGNPPQPESAPQATVANNAHGIYDEHQSLNHPAKQKSGHWVVIAIVLVIVVFISLGVAAFFILGPGI